LYEQSQVLLTQGAQINISFPVGKPIFTSINSFLSTFKEAMDDTLAYEH
jgi:hypothetical protein